MKRFLLATIVLLGGLVSLAHADYVIIIFNLGLANEGKEEGLAGSMPPGYGMGMGMGMPPGGGPGMGMGPGSGSGLGLGPYKPGGMGLGPYKPGGMGPPGPAGGGSSGSSGPTEGGVAGGPPTMGSSTPGGGGSRGGPPPGMGMGMGPAPTPGGRGGPGMGMGMGPAPTPGGRGSMGGPPPGMGMGPPPSPGMGMGSMGGPGGGMSGFYNMGLGFAGGGSQEGDTKFSPLLAVGVVEVVVEPNSYRGMPLSSGGSIPIYKIRHKWGETYLPDSVIDNKLRILRRKAPTLAKSYDDQLKKAQKEGKNPASWLALAEWTLRHGLQKEFVKSMEELAQLDKNHAAVQAFQKVQADMARPLTRPDTSANLRKKFLETYKTAESEHYTLLHNLEASKEAEVKSRLERLEENYRFFFYWFALRGKALGVPDERLVAVLTMRQEEFDRQHQIFDSEPLVADGFLARRDNLAVFSLERLDAGAVALNKSLASTWQKFDLSVLLSKQKKFPKDTKPEEGLEVQTLALLQKALEEESVIATVSHEGSRQLLAATSLLPRQVAVPQWLQFGMASFFESPKGSLGRGVGAPSATILADFNYLGRYKSLDPKKMDKTRDLTLEKVVTDQFFREAQAQSKDREPLLKARTLSWALTYYLAQKQLEGLLRYQKELAKLPRDLEFDNNALLLCFARAFDLLDPNNPKAVDRPKMANLANQWHDYIAIIPSDCDNLLKELDTYQKEINKGGTNTMETRPGTGPGKPPSGPLQ